MCDGLRHVLNHRNVIMLSALGILNGVLQGFVNPFYVFGYSGMLSWVRPGGAPVAFADNSNLGIANSLVADGMGQHQGTSTVPLADLPSYKREKDTIVFVRSKGSRKVRYNHCCVNLANFRGFLSKLGFRSNTNIGNVGNVHVVPRLTAARGRTFS